MHKWSTTVSVEQCNFLASGYFKGSATLPVSVSFWSSHRSQWKTTMQLAVRTRSYPVLSCRSPNVLDAGWLVR